MSQEVFNSNAACCSIPPVVGHGYKPKGVFEKVGDFDKVYKIGTSKTHALVCVYDIFAYFPQTQQGADILSTSIGSGATVFMPDFLSGKPWPIDRFPPKTEQDKKELQEFFKGPANPHDNLIKLVRFAKHLRSHGYSKVSLYGFCWGGKVAILSGGLGGDEDLFDAIALVHPAMLSVDDVKNLSVPLALFPSKDEDPKVVEHIVEELKKKPFWHLCRHKTYTNMHHGWAAARGDLENKENKAAYEDVYSRLAAFFETTWA
jgi:dienelactone hydrolase